MSSVEHQPRGWRQLAQLHKGLLSQIEAAEGELQRIECFDEEQRSEIQSILEALRHESQTHAALIEGMDREAAHA
jgi:hypothetical protein